MGKHKLMYFGYMIDGKRRKGCPVKEMTRMGLPELRDALFDRPQWRRIVKMVTGFEIGLVGKSETRRRKEGRSIKNKVST